MASPRFFGASLRRGEERQHPEFDVCEQGFGRQIGQFPSEAGHQVDAPSDDHVDGGGAL